MTGFLYLPEVFVYWNKAFIFGSLCQSNRNKPLEAGRKMLKFFTSSQETIVVQN